MKVIGNFTNNYQQNTVNRKSDAKSNIKFGNAGAELYRTIPRVRPIQSVLKKLEPGDIVINRVDANAEFSEDFTRILNRSRLEALVPSFEILGEKVKAVALTHFSDGGSVPTVIKGLEELLPGRQIEFEPNFNKLYDVADDLEPGGIVFGDDVRKGPEVPEKFKGDNWEEASNEFAETLKGKAKAIINSALPVSHREDHTTMSKLPGLFDPEYRAGDPSMIYELEQFSEFLKFSDGEPSHRWVAGGKTDKVRFLEKGVKFLPAGSIQDVGGALVNTVIKELGYEFGELSRIDKDPKRLNSLRKFLEKGEVKKDGHDISILYSKGEPNKYVTVSLPPKLVVKREDGRIQEQYIDEISHDGNIVDLAPASMAKVREHMNMFSSSYINGPAGKTPEHPEGTKLLGEIIQEYNNKGGYAVGGGSDTKGALDAIFGEQFVPKSFRYYANSGGMGAELANGFDSSALRLYQE